MSLGMSVVEKQNDNITVSICVYHQIFYFKLEHTTIIIERNSKILKIINFVRTMTVIEHNKKRKKLRR